LHDESSSEDDEEDNDLEDDGVQVGDGAKVDGGQANGEPEDQGREFHWSKTASNPGAYSTFYFSEHEQGPKVNDDLKSPSSFLNHFSQRFF